jgi:hypothetical protein
MGLVKRRIGDLDTKAVEYCVMGLATVIGQLKLIKDCDATYCCSIHGEPLYGGTYHVTAIAKCEKTTFYLPVFVPLK